MTTKQLKTHWPNNGLGLVITLILFSLGIVSCSKFSREKRSDDREMQAWNASLQSGHYSKVKS